MRIAAYIPLELDSCISIPLSSVADGAFLTSIKTHKSWDLLTVLKSFTVRFHYLLFPTAPSEDKNRARPKPVAGKNLAGRRLNNFGLMI